MQSCRVEPKAGFRRMLGVCSHSADHIPVSALQVRSRVHLFALRPTYYHYHVPVHLEIDELVRIFRYGF